MDALLLALQNVCSQLLPIFGAAALVFLCICLKKLSVLIEETTKKIQKLDPTIDKVDQSLQKIQVPLDSMVKFSKSVDKVQDKTVETFNKMSNIAVEGIADLKDFTADKFKKDNTSSKNDVDKTEGDNV